MYWFYVPHPPQLAKIINQNIQSIKPRLLRVFYGVQSGIYHLCLPISRQPWPKLTFIVNTETFSKYTPREKTADSMRKVDGGSCANLRRWRINAQSPVPLPYHMNMGMPWQSGLEEEEMRDLDEYDMPSIDDTPWRTRSNLVG